MAKLIKNLDIDGSYVVENSDTRIKLNNAAFPALDNIDDLGTEKDWDQLFYQKGISNTAGHNIDSVASFDVEISGTVFFVELLLVGTQSAYIDGNRIYNNPALFLETGKENIDFGDECWITAEYSLKDIKDTSIVSSYDLFQTVYGSIDEFFESFSVEDFGSISEALIDG